ncbi:hypothetical protein GCM10007320_64940 [Pseudorhodoferax aquiterrae]|uniref:PIG-L family deacetylase n=1 Tax=Pseudorhodoferax aquiterrae TaxID=747304 RepID=A0ABQ3GF78_9BURK|nr:PIG-L family deacetylase [Pseudorhodoferax aquiterrae]GHD04236.1 hypothetical protein GCM10007320_64940 [Pseudorhodoferax aquiterrae]
MDTVSERRIEGEGTAEADWRTWLHGQPLARVQAAQPVSPLQRAVVVAPHPDDEVLMVGGLLAALAQLQGRTVVVAVTDGEASHAGSRRWTPAALARRRSEETDTALGLLGVRAGILRLGLGDGQVAARAGRLARRLQALLTPDDVVFTTWAFDGHPDHEACARAARAAPPCAAPACMRSGLGLALGPGRHAAHALGPRPAAGAAGRAAGAQARGRAGLSLAMAPRPRSPAHAGAAAATARVQRPFELLFA